MFTATTSRKLERHCKVTDILSGAEIIARGPAPKVGEASKFWGWLNNRAIFKAEVRGNALEVGPGFYPTKGCTAAFSKDNGDAFKLPYADKQFDLVVAHEVTCAYNPEARAKLMAEFERVGKAVYVREMQGCFWKALSICGCKEAAKS